MDIELPTGLDERSADWHHEKIAEFTLFKQQIGEPSPHLAIVGYLSKGKDFHTKGWYLGCYGATYCLPSAQMIWEHWTWQQVLKDPHTFEIWIYKNWAGIITRTERRCVRTPAKMTRCLVEYAVWLDQKFDHLLEYQLKASDSQVYYDFVWDELTSVYSFGRYIGIRIIEGFRRYCGIPATLYDVRSIGGWSPRKCLCYLYPDSRELLLTDSIEGMKITDELTYDLINRMKGIVKVNTYVMAAMLCEYRVAFENRKQYPGWTLDQEPLLYDKAKKFWGKSLESAGLWEARAAIFPHEALGEFEGWNGTRWVLTCLLRDYEYNWSDLLYDYKNCLYEDDWSNPVYRLDADHLQTGWEPGGEK